MGKGASDLNISKMDKNYIIEIPELEILEAKGELLRLSKVTHDIFMKVHEGFKIQSVERSFLDEVDAKQDELNGINTIQWCISFRLIGGNSRVGGTGFAVCAFVINWHLYQLSVEKKEFWKSVKN